MTMSRGIIKKKALLAGEKFPLPERARSGPPSLTTKYLLNRFAGELAQSAVTDGPPPLTPI
jgi:hypothetical protein